MDSISPELKATASVLNFLSASQTLDCPSNKEEFIRISLDECLKNNIISEESSKHPIWAKHNIEIVDHGDVEFSNPHSILRYSTDPPAPESKWCWNFTFKRVILPKKWKLMGSHHSKMYEGGNLFAIVDEHNQAVEMLSYFPGYNIYESREHPALTQMDAMTKSTDDINEEID